MFCLSWSSRATRNTSHDSWPHFHTHVVSFQKSPLQICRVSRRIWRLLSAPVSRPCWNRKSEGTCGDKHSCCATPNVHTVTPLGILSGDVPCSQAQRTHSRTAIGWCSMELVTKLFDTPTCLLIFKFQTQEVQCVYKRNIERLPPNHLCRGKAKSTTYSSVALGIQHVPYCTVCVLSHCIAFCAHYFRGNVFEPKMCVLIASTTVV